MNTKLALTIEHKIIERAKNYAKEKNRSLSDLIENYLKSLTKDVSEKKSNKFSPVTYSFKGFI